jgi:hypothetical protein
MELRTLGLRTISLAFLAPDFVKAAVDGGIDNGLNSIPSPSYRRQSRRTLRSAEGKIKPRLSYEGGPGLPFFRRERDNAAR